MVAYEGYESSRDNFGKFTYQLQHKTRALVRNFKKDPNKII